MSYHPGEIEVQERAGVRLIAERNKGVYREMPDVAMDFLSSQPFLFLGAAEEDGTMWASAVFGVPGFVRASDPRTVIVGSLPADGDPLLRCLFAGNPVATIAMDFATRRRMRTNGMISAVGPASFTLQTDQVYGNCPKYIQAREWTLREGIQAESSTAGFMTLTKEALSLISRADTFFIASHHPESGADVSHRGGMPGFVVAEDNETLAFPDYRGNAMFNTLGNLNEYPQAGLLFIDFDSGSLLQLTGTVEIEWDVEGSPHDLLGTERIVRFHLERGRLMRNAMPLTWSPVQYSPANPKVRAEG
ncbi:pyridoxamine 5'-phosphate oxidase family protein [Paenibacillus sp. R14(2021)]|uniref:pyridoxamine 5'-phosphate oxidase family protein n=1 Tax=Paenibacillus sp. R14(2021) TaxID=2859228 RepID=UPI001C611872|nr:pyridoxamine 5'-phosphate oxidase family protein [Paenibacillus sp. R14(2021)]